MKNKYPSLLIAAFAAAVLLFAGLVSVQAVTSPASSTQSLDISFLSSSQINDLAQLNSQKIQKIKQNSSTIQESVNLNSALNKYNVPSAVQAELDRINSKSPMWTANYNRIFAESAQEKINLLGVKPNAKITNLLKSSPQTQVQGFSLSHLVSGFLGYFKNLSSSNLLAGLVKALPKPVDNFGDASLPASFDWKNVGGQNYVTPVKDQGQCGDCWAFGATASLEGDINAYYNNPAISADLSEEDLLSCQQSGNCSAGATADQIETIFNNHFIKTGITQEACFPYTSGDGSNGVCSAKCNTWAHQVWKTDSAFKIIVDPNKTSDSATNINAIKNALVNYGPVEVGMAVYYDFFSYSGGIYYHTTNNLAGYHAVAIIGYGSEDGVSYWIVKNSWGSDWGENGYFRIMMNDSMIDQWFAFAPGVPSYTTSNTKLCTDNDKDGYCYWGTGSKPTSGCPASCLISAITPIEDCDDSNPSIYQGCGALTQAIGFLSITSTPSPADVYIQDVSSGSWIYRGQTPLTINLNIGNRSIKVSKEDYIDKIIGVNITSAKPASINAGLPLGPKITYPLNDDVLRGGDVININGNSGDIGSIGNYRVEWSKDSNSWSNRGIILINGGKKQISNGKLATWDTSFIKTPGNYSLRLTSIIGGVNYIKSIQTIYLDPTLSKGWPQRIAYSLDNYQGSGNGALFFTSAKYYSVAGISSQDNSPQMKTLTNTNKNSSGLYSVNQNSLGAVGPQALYWAGYLEPVVADLNNDGKQEIIVYKGGNPPELDVFNPDGTMLWKKGIAGDAGAVGVPGGNIPIPIVGDINNDGKNEIIVFNPNFSGKSTNNSILYALRSDGSVLWKIYIPFDGQPTILMADFNGDGKKEIVVKGNSSYPNLTMSVVGSAGKLISQWNLPESTCGASVVPSPAVGRFAGSEKLQIVSITPSAKSGYDPNTQSWVNEAELDVFNEDGSLLPGWPVYLPGLITSSPVVGDMNNDGKDEIVVGLTYSSNIFPDNSLGGLYAFDRNGNILPGWPVEKGWNFWSTPALADVNGDGYLEISASRLGFQTYLFRYDGTVMNGWPQTTGWNDYYGSVMGDINADSKVDVVTTAGSGFYSYYGRQNDGGVYAWNTDGSMISGFPKATEEDAQAPAVLGDVDKDGKTELLASSDWDFDFVNSAGKNRGSVYVWKTNEPYNQTNMPWPTFMHDIQRTGCYDCTKKFVGINGVCGPAKGTTFTSAGVTAADLCSAGKNSNLSNVNGTWYWTCYGSKGGLDIACTGTVPPSTKK